MCPQPCPSSSGMITSPTKATKAEGQVSSCWTLALGGVESRDLVSEGRKKSDLPSILAKWPSCLAESRSSAVPGPETSVDASTASSWSFCPGPILWQRGYLLASLCSSVLALENWEGPREEGGIAAWPKATLTHPWPHPGSRHALIKDRYSEAQLSAS